MSKPFQLAIFTAVLIGIAVFGALVAFDYYKSLKNPPVGTEHATQVDVASSESIQEVEQPAEVVTDTSVEDVEVVTAAETAETTNEEPEPLRCAANTDKEICNCYEVDTNKRVYLEYEACLQKAMEISN